MDPARKQRRNGIMIVIAVLVVVCVWWAVFVPLTQRYKVSRREAELKKAIQAIPLPAGAKTAGVNADHLTVYRVTMVWATGIYSTESDCKSVITHYKEEFARHGVSPRSQAKNVRVDPEGIYFSTPDYEAHVSCTALPVQTSTYTVIYTVTLTSPYVLD